MASPLPHDHGVNDADKIPLLSEDIVLYKATRKQGKSSHSHNDVYLSLIPCSHVLHNWLQARCSHKSEKHDQSEKIKAKIHRKSDSRTLELSGSRRVERDVDTVVTIPTASRSRRLHGSRGRSDGCNTRGTGICLDGDI